MPIPYIYRPLVKDKKDIRLFRLQFISSGTPDHEAEIFGEIEHASLLEDPSYSTLSYVWGEPVYSSRIMLDDGTHIAITRNLLVALLHVVEFQHLTQEQLKTPGSGASPSSISLPTADDDIDNVTARINAFMTKNSSSGDKNADLLLWIDAVCINQEDDNEKSWQVSLMADLYTRAQCTFIFLGPRTKYSDDAVELFETLGTQAKALSILTGIDELHERIWHVLQSRAEDDSEKDESQDVDAFIASIVQKANEGVLFRLAQAIVGCTWFFRTWVRRHGGTFYLLAKTLQEFVLSTAPIFLIGNKRLHPDHLSATLILLEALRHVVNHSHIHLVEKLSLREFDTGQMAQRLSYPGVELFQRRRMPQKPPWKPSFRDVFLATLCTKNEFQATDPRDIVYSLLGLVEDWGSNNYQIEPDYSLQCPETYTKAAFELLWSGCVEILRLAVTGKSRTGLPSWVPDFSKRSAPDITVKPPPEELTLGPECKISQDGKQILKLEGVTYGKIWCAGLRCFLEQDRDDVELVHRLREMSDRNLTYAYCTALSTIFSREFNSDADVRFQLYMLAVAVMYTGRSVLGPPMGHFDFPKSFDEDEFHPEADQDNIWNTALIMRDIIMNPKILDATPLYGMELNSDIILRRDYPTAFEDTIAPHQNGAPVKLWAVAKVYTDFSGGLLRCEPFIVENLCVGTAMKSIRNEDVLVKFDIDPNALYVVRRAGDDLWELVSTACVPRFWTQEDFPKGEPATFRLC